MIDKIIDIACWVIGWSILMGGALYALALEWPK
jgi:hypothetical protein